MLVGGGFPSFGGGSCDISINGTSKVTGGTLPAGGGASTFDSATYGTEDVAFYGGVDGLDFNVTIY